tara:strand:+ start:168 stop:707 length:540 start_codon:yes stop_codon:yes gene_type:complete
MKQNSFFPELDKIEYNDENRVDISTLPSSDFRKNKLSEIPKETYYIYRTGGINPFIKDDKNDYPVFKSFVGNSPKVLKLHSGGKSIVYPATHLKPYSNGCTYKLYIHILTSLAFIINDNVKLKTYVNHIDGNPYNYHLSNLEWVSPQQNSLDRRTDLNSKENLNNLTLQFYNTKKGSKH